MVCRWPLHPQPYPDEALSSWINRLAATYGVDPIEFLGFEFGHLMEREQFELIDINPPYSLLEGLAERTGIELSEIRALTAQAYVPLLIDSLTPLPGYYADYTCQFNLIIHRKKPLNRNVENWIPWLTMKRFLKTQGCKACIDEDKEPYIRLYWRFPWMMSCPKHGLLLKDVRLFSMPLNWKMQAIWIEGAEPQEAPEILSRMDAITLKAVTLGVTKIPAGNMHGGVWLRMLRAILEELSLPLLFLPIQARRLMESFWKKLDLPFRHNLSRWRPFEECKQESQYILMHLASLIFEDACDRQSSLPNSLVNSFSPIPIFEKDLVSFYASSKGFPKLDKSKDAPWGNINMLMDRIIEGMRRDPEEVKRFRRMIYSLNGSEETRRRVDDSLRNLGIQFGEGL